MVAQSGIQKIVEHRLRGISTTRAERPRVLPPRDGVVYFELDRDAADWSDVRAERAIALHLAAEAGMTTEALSSLGVELYVVFG